MPLDAQIARLLAQTAGDAAPASLAALRANTDIGLRALQGEMPASGGVRDWEAIADDGYRIRIRAYSPVGAAGGAQPAMLFAHGGGWCLGSLALYDQPCQALANAAGRVVLSVDYRLAPEHPFPRPLEDVYQALCWAAEQAAPLGIDAARLAIGGDSAGGNLAAAAALLARDRGGPRIEHQLLLYPALSREMATASYRKFAEGYFLTREAMVFCWQNYLGARRDPLAEPLHAACLAGLPPAIIASCEYDPLRDEAERYAQRLREAGVAVRCERLAGMVHACMHMLGVTPAARQLFALAD
ncbi:alpha/beta hydrolase [Serratia entomophila]|uniref:alpha/beta hydrolase n=1 Tax=Serratia entomophila TaxID=42906 RepID=UPI002178237E|nr:alpha/beta hydrolase [Serratia entomophila]CAI0787864.1 Lipase 2 [Serratia entomophila]CAI0791453.1 Lipase 2 [Serratia entomophila]CAI0792408.1 Lipase 2 [Serratia entomophila]CAI0792590.1 Lipase 2 [Serratia entomophila]CAI1545242.1 Lipase 2 [Serratia entomophila]